MRENGIPIGENRVARLMKEGKIKAENRRKRKPRTTDSNHRLPVVPNRIQQDFQATGVNQKWVSDITCIRVGSEWQYLCVILDLYNREVVGWSLAEHMRTDLVTEAYRKARAKRMPEEGLIFHSDRGSQYASHEFRRLLEANSVTQSMSRKGNCYDNAVAESFFRTLKVEEVYTKIYRDGQEARRNLFDYIEVHYNRKRRHSSLGYLSPIEFYHRNIVAR